MYHRTAQPHSRTAKCGGITSDSTSDRGKRLSDAAKRRNEFSTDYSAQVGENGGTSRFSVRL